MPSPTVFLSTYGFLSSAFKTDVNEPAESRMASEICIIELTSCVSIVMIVITI